MSSVREQILEAFYTALKTLQTSSIGIYRNLDKSLPPPTSGGLIILRDGVSNDPETLLSPLTYIYEHLATIEVIVQQANELSRDQAVDALLVSIGNVVIGNRTLGGLAEWVEAHAPEFNDEPIEGAPTLRLATLQVLIRFSTANPLN